MIHLALCIQLLGLIAQTSQAQAPSIALRAGISTLSANLSSGQHRVEIEGVRPGGASLIQTREVEATWLTPALALGLQLDLSDWLTTWLQLDAMLNSFVSNEAKNGRVYGARIGLGAAYMWRIGALEVGAGLQLALRLRGYGVTSFDRGGQPSIKFGDSELYDDDIGVHIIDTAWQLGPALLTSWQLTQGWRIMLALDLLWTARHRSAINVAGELESAEVAWERVALDDGKLDLDPSRPTISSTSILDREIEVELIRERR
jgi:hypothetical protein